MKKNDKTKFKAFVQFPRNAVIREVVEVLQAKLFCYVI